MASADEKQETVDLFGGDESWHESGWTASNDSVRGGKSTSDLEVNNGVACFSGHLDYKTLGGAGFASQKYTGSFDLAKYKAIQLKVSRADKKRYTFILKDELLPPSENGREQATISYEVDFGFEDGTTSDQTVTIPFDSLTPTYRGKPKKDAASLDTSSIKQVSLMMRSHFGAQSGDFSLSIASISAVTRIPKHSDQVIKSEDDRALEEGHGSRDDAKANYYTVRIGTSHTNMEIRIHRLLAVALIGIALFTISYRWTC